MKPEPTMPSTQPQHPHQQHSSSSSSSHPLHLYGANSGVASSSSSRATQGAPTQQLFSDERRDAIALPKIETDAASVVSSHPSSPYSSPHLAPRGRAGAIGNMEEVTLPPIQAAVPMRRGAVSGASSGPSLPFPPIRLSYEDEDVPSRGPSPTLGKRSSFSMGHSNHVPPGPEVQLPTPVLSGSGERRGGIASTSSYVAVHSLYHGGDGDVPRSEGLGGAQLGASGQRPNLPWMQHKTSVSHPESADHAPPFHPFQPSSPSPANSFTSHRPSHFNDEHSRSYSHAQQPAHPHHHSHPPSSSGGYRYDFHREGSAMSPGSNHSLLPGEHHSPLSPRMHSSHMMPSEEQHHHLLQDVDSSLNGKRPRSAPRVMSSQPRIFACSQCPARFARNHDLKRHQRGHLSVRPYPCNWCGKSFSRKDALKRHILVKGCGKDGKGGGGGGKSDDKGKRSRGDEDRKRTHRTESSGGDQEDGQFGEEEDDNGSEENQDDGTQWVQHPHRSFADYGRASNYEGTTLQVAESSYPDAALALSAMATQHRRPSASVA